MRVRANERDQPEARLFNFSSGIPGLMNDRRLSRSHSGKKVISAIKRFGAKVRFTRDAKWMPVCKSARQNKERGFCSGPIEAEKAPGSPQLDSKSVPKRDRHSDDLECSLRRCDHLTHAEDWPLAAGSAIV